MLSATTDQRTRDLRQASSLDVKWENVRHFPPPGWTVGKVLGKGMYGTVFYGTDAKGTEVAIKKMHHDANEKHRDAIDLEVSLLKYTIDRLDDSCKKHVTTYMGHFAAQGENGKLSHYIVTKYVDGKSLENAIPEILNSGDDLATIQKRVRKVVRTALHGLHCLHDIVGIAHRDIKPENVLVTPSDDSVIIDVGLSCFLDKPYSCDNLIGGYDFISPERFMAYYRGENQLPETVMQKRGDLWALGQSLLLGILGPEGYIRGPDDDDDLTAFQWAQTLLKNETNTKNEVLNMLDKGSSLKNDELHNVIANMFILPSEDRPTASELMMRLPEEETDTVAANPMKGAAQPSDSEEEDDGHRFRWDEQELYWD